MSLVRTAWSISGLTLLSRVLGLARDAMTYHVLGAGWAVGTFVLAWMVPNLLRRMFEEGALSAAFVPAFAQTLERDGLVRARDLLAGITGALILALGTLSAVVVLASFLLPAELWGLHTGDGSDPAERGRLLWDLLAILFPYAVPVCLLAVYSGALNSLGVFALPASAPAVLNLFWIGGLVYATESGTTDLASVTRIVATALLLGGLVQLLLVLVPLRRRDCLPAPRLPRGDPRVRGVVRAMGPALLGLSAVQLNLVVDQVLAEYLVGPGANNHIYLANRLLLFPHALVALPLATAVFPTLATEADDAAALRASLGRAVSLTLFLAVPATVGMILVAPDLIAIVFEHGRFTAEDTPSTRWTTTTLVLGLPALGVAQLYARALYARGDTASPARIAGWLVLLNLALNFVFVLGLRSGVAGFTAATSVCTFANAIALRRVLALNVPGPGIPWRALARTAAATAAMAVAVGLTQEAPAATDRLARALGHLALPIAVGIAVYLGAQAAMRSPELRALAERYSRRTNSM